MYTIHLLSLLALAASTLAKTDLSGCTTSNTISWGGAYVIWYVPGTGELCEPLDCGGGRAPPKTTVPGCAAYIGTATYEPSYLPGYGPNSSPATATSAVESASATSAEAAVTTDSSATGYTAASSTSGVVVVTESSGTTANGLTTITSAASLTVSKSAGASGANNLTATATPSTTSLSTNAASASGVARDLLGMAVGVVAGLAML